MSENFNHTGLQIRPYGASDCEMLVDAIDQVCAEGRWMQTDRYVPNESWKHALALPECPCHLLLVACDGDRLIGWCRAYPDEDFLSAEIGIGILGAYRERGLGSVILQQAVLWAVERGLVTLHLETRQDNGRALHTFEKIGFRVLSPELAIPPPPPGWLKMVLPTSPED